MQIDTQTTEHYTAWLTTVDSLLESDNADVIVLRDVVGSYREDDEGNEIPEWTTAADDDPPGAGPADVFRTTLGHCEADDIATQADDALRAAGWRRVDEWENVDSGATATVEKR